MDKELLYNRSGIKDITAYRAINKLQTEGGTRDMVGFEINKGEIWEVESGDNTKLVVVINCFERYAATVILQDQEPLNNSVQIRARSIMYADAGRLGWIYYNKMIEFVRTLSEKEEAELLKAICSALNLKTETNLSSETVAIEAKAELEAAQREIESLHKALETAKQDTDILGCALEEAQADAEELRRQLEETAPAGSCELLEDFGIREELAAVRKEAEIYKGLYENMLARALG